MEKTIEDIVHTFRNKGIICASYYPNLAIKNRIFPQHLSEDFCDIYEEIYNTRKEAKIKSKKDKNDKNAIAVNSGLKLSLNSLYGCYCFYISIKQNTPFKYIFSIFVLN